MEQALDRWYRRRTNEIATDRSRAEGQAWLELGALARNEVSGRASGAAPAGGSGDDRLANSSARYPRLTGCRGLAGNVANAINAVTGGPNTVGRFTHGINKVELQRGADDVIRGGSRAPISISATGRLLPPSRRKEVAISVLGGKTYFRPIESVPETVRVFNTPSGELRYELDGDLRIETPIFVFKREAGQYVIR